MKDKVIAAILATIMLLNFFDVLSDISLGVPMWHIVEESIVVLASAAGMFYILMDIWERTKHIEILKHELAISDDKLNNISAEMLQARNEYSELILQQFDNWKLTKSEKEVAMLLLKGLTLREIGEVRATKEKTVRQQASNIYLKAQVEGRHQFAAWFFEDFLQPTHT